MDAQADLGLGCPHTPKDMFSHGVVHPVSILYKSIAGRYRPVRVADGPITARYRFIKNASWAHSAIIIDPFFFACFLKCSLSTLIPEYVKL